MNYRKRAMPDERNRLMDADELGRYICLGRNSAMAFGKEIGAEIRIGRRILFDRVKVDQYLDSATGGKKMMDRYDWADQERLVQQDVEELDKLDRMRKRRKRLAEEYREREFKDEDENA